MNSQVTTIAEIMAQPQEFFWLPWAVQYFFFIGISACAVLYACWQHWMGQSQNQRLEMIAVFYCYHDGDNCPFSLDR